MNGWLLSAADIQAWIAGLFWPFFRIAGLFMIMPVLGETEVPMRVRVGLAMVISILIAPVAGPMPAVDPMSLDSLFITVQQILIGLIMGLVLQFVFNAVMLAGESVAITMGLGFAVLNDPQYGVQVPSISQFYLIMAVLIFLALNGHHAMLELVVDSFNVVPVGESLAEEALWTLLRLGSTIFSGALAIAIPGLAAMLTVNLVMGVMTRSAPQLNIFSVGFSMTMTVGFLAILLTLPAFGQTFERLLAEIQLGVEELLDG